MKKYANLTEKVYNQILELMVNGEITPGQKLTFIDLATQFAVSRTPINNALSLLAQEGYLDFTPNRGYTMHKLTTKEAKHLRGIQEVLEVGFIGQAIKNMTDMDKLKLILCKDAYAQAIDNRKDRKLLLLDIEFHAAIFDLADNPVFSNGYRHICRKLFLCLHEKQIQPKLIRDTRDEHDSLYQALCSKDVEQARKLLILRQTSLGDSSRCHSTRFDRFEEPLVGSSHNRQQSFYNSRGF